jgi:RNA-binding protein
MNLCYYGVLWNGDKMTSKQRAYLMSLAHDLQPIFQLGKSSLTPEFAESIREAFQTRELMKISVLNNCGDDPRALAETLAGRTKSQVVQIIGKKIVLYKENKDDPQIVLPKA